MGPDNINLITIDTTAFLAAITSMIAALWGGLVWFVRTSLTEARQREKHLAESAASRERAMGNALGEMEHFQRTVLVNLVQGNQAAMSLHAEAVKQNTQATEELRKEVCQLRQETIKNRYLARRNNDSDDSGID